MPFIRSSDGAPALPFQRGAVNHAPHPIHVLASEVFLGSERVVRAAPKLEMVERRRAAERVGATMMNFEAERLAASLAAIVAVCAARTIAVELR